MQTESPQRPENKIRSSLLLTLTALIWGLAFVAQRVGMDFIGPFLFMGIRMILGALTLLIVVFVQGLWQSAHRTDKGIEPLKTPAASQTEARMGPKRLVIAGMAGGSVLFLAGCLQQIGLVYTTASKAGFLTALYIVLVPILGILIKKRTHWNTWVSVLVALVGLYFLCITETLRITSGDLVILIAAFFWACHILVVDHFVKGLTQRDLLKFCIAQFTVAAVMSLICFPFFDGRFVSGAFEMASLIGALPFVLYVGVLSTGVAFTLQALGQQGINPSAASIIMSLEAVFSVIGGMVILHEIMSSREVIGCVLMFTAVILSQLSFKQRERGT